MSSLCLTFCQNRRTQTQREARLDFAKLVIELSPPNACGRRKSRVINSASQRHHLHCRLAQKVTNAMHSSASRRFLFWRNFALDPLQEEFQFSLFSWMIIVVRLFYELHAFPHRNAKRGAIKSQPQLWWWIIYIKEAPRCGRRVLFSHVNALDGRDAKTTACLDLPRTVQVDVWQGGLSMLPQLLLDSKSISRIVSAETAILHSRDFNLLAMQSAVCVSLIIHNTLHVSRGALTRRAREREGVIRRNRCKTNRRISLSKYLSVWCHWHGIIIAAILASSRDMSWLRDELNVQSRDCKSHHSSYVKMCQFGIIAGSWNINNLSLSSTFNSLRRR